MSVKQKRYAPEFRQSAVSLVREQGYSHAEAANRLGIPVQTLKSWLKKAKVNSSDFLPPEAKSQAEEFKRLRKENQRLQMENEILKKAAAYFARESL